jgi:hypothetical protein
MIAVAIFPKTCASNVAIAYVGFGNASRRSGLIKGVFLGNVPSCS